MNTFQIITLIKIKKIEKINKLDKRKSKYRNMEDNINMALKVETKVDINSEIKAETKVDSIIPPIKLKRNDPNYMKEYYKRTKHKIEKRTHCELCDINYITYKAHVHLNSEKHNRNKRIHDLEIELLNRK